MDTSEREREREREKREPDAEAPGPGNGRTPAMSCPVWWQVRRSAVRRQDCVGQPQRHPAHLFVAAPLAVTRLQPSRLVCGGTEDEASLQALCAACNLSKGAA